jgi:hypothetical protein
MPNWIRSTTRRTVAELLDLMLARKPVRHPLSSDPVIAHYSYTITVEHRGKHYVLELTYIGPATTNDERGQRRAARLRERMDV